MTRRKHSIKRRNKRSRHSKRGGDGNTTAELIAMEEGKKYSTSLPYLHNPKAVTAGLLVQPIHEEKREEAVREEAVREEAVREEAEREFVILGKKYEDEIKRQKEIKAVRKTLRNHVTSTEAADFFSKPSKKHCDPKDPGCNIMGGRKSRKHKRHFKKNRKSRRR